MKRQEIVSQLCTRYHLNAAEASEVLFGMLDNKKFNSIEELHQYLNDLENLGD